MMVGELVSNGQIAITTTASQHSGLLKNKHRRQENVRRELWGAVGEAGSGYNQDIVHSYYIVK